MRDAVLNLSEAIANELMLQNMLDVTVFVATPVIAIMLREAHLPELVEAGQAMRNAKFDVWEMCSNPSCPTCELGRNWDAAKAAFLKGAEK